MTPEKIDTNNQQPEATPPSLSMIRQTDYIKNIVCGILADKEYQIEGVYEKLNLLRKAYSIHEPELTIFDYGIMKLQSTEKFLERICTATRKGATPTYMLDIHEIDRILARLS